MRRLSIRRSQVRPLRMRPLRVRSWRMRSWRARIVIVSRWCIAAGSIGAGEIILNRREGPVILGLSVRRSTVTQARCRRQIRPQRRRAIVCSVLNISWRWRRSIIMSVAMRLPIRATSRVGWPIGSRFGTSLRGVVVRTVTVGNVAVRWVSIRIAPNRRCAGRAAGMLLRIPVRVAAIDRAVRRRPAAAPPHGRWRRRWPIATNMRGIGSRTVACERRNARRVAVVTTLAIVALDRPATIVGLIRGRETTGRHSWGRCRRARHRRIGAVCTALSAPVTTGRPAPVHHHMQPCRYQKTHAPGRSRPDRRRYWSRRNARPQVSLPASPGSHRNMNRLSGIVAER
jgi:hypothetical protein